MPGTTEAKPRGNEVPLMSDMAGNVAMVGAVSDERLARTILDYAKKMFFQAFGSPLMLTSIDD